MGRQAKSREQLKGLGVNKISKEQALESWAKVQENYGSEYISNCCGAKIIEEVVDGTARCPECYEGCMAIKS
jgi:hypothetical protein